VEIHKAPLRAGLSYPLRPSAFKDALEKAAIRTAVVLHQRTETWWTEGVLFRADFYPPARPGARTIKGETLHVTCRSVPSSEKQDARVFLENQTVPEFIDWLKVLESEPANSTVKREQPSFARTWSPSR
jgi:hypothetical protein